MWPSARRKLNAASLARGLQRRLPGRLRLGPSRPGRRCQLRLHCWTAASILLLGRLGLGLCLGPAYCSRPGQSFNELTFVGGGDVIFALGGSRGFNGGWSWNFTALNDGIDLALQRFDLFPDSNNASELAC